MNALRERLVPIWVFVILWVSSAYFWHSRDWNSASRLMLVYSLGDRGSIRLDGLQRQTGDKAFFEGSYYTDKQPGYSLLALPAYLFVKPLFGLPTHPVNEQGFPWWPADYAITVLTSGLATALSGAMLAWFSMRLGCGPRRALLVGLAYGLSTPAYVYATLAYGHQSAACALLGSFLLIQTSSPESPRLTRRLFGAGFLAAYASIIELSVGPVSALLGFFLLARVAGRRLPARGLAWFALGAVGPTLILLGYNLLAFGSPLDLGYAHHAIPRFRAVHSHQNPLGLRAPDVSKIGPLLIEPYRGLFCYAPIVALAPLGWVALLARRRVGPAVMSMAVCLTVFLVNLSYPEWTGGWSTGPRLLVPMLPFSMIGVAGVLGAFDVKHVAGKVVTGLALALSLAGGVLMLLFQGVGGRIPDEVYGEPLRSPLRAIVWPLWSGARVPPWWVGERFSRNLASWMFPEWVRNLEPERAWMPILPLVAVQAVLIALAVWSVWPRRAGDAYEDRS